MVFQFRARTSELLFLSMGASLKGEKLLHNIEVLCLIVRKAHAFMIINIQLGPHSLDSYCSLLCCIFYTLKCRNLYDSPAFVIWREVIQCITALFYFEALDRCLGEFSLLIS